VIKDTERVLNRIQQERHGDQALHENASAPSQIYDNLNLGDDTPNLGLHMVESVGDFVELPPQNYVQRYVYGDDGIINQYAVKDPGLRVINYLGR